MHRLRPLLAPQTRLKQRPVRRRMLRENFLKPWA